MTDDLRPIDETGERDEIGAPSADDDDIDPADVSATAKPIYG